LSDSPGIDRLSDSPGIGSLSDSPGQPHLKGFINVYMCTQFEPDTTYGFLDVKTEYEQKDLHYQYIIQSCILQYRQI